MGVKEKAEACGRCAMTSVVDVTSQDGSPSNPFGGDHIEIPEDKMKVVSRHVVALGSIKDRLNEWATAFTYGR